MQSFQLSVAGFDFTIFSKSEIQLVIEEGYFSFLTNEKSFNSIQMEVFDFLPEVLENDFEKVYSAESNEQSFWSIYKLPNGYRNVFILHDVEGFEHEEVARKMGISVGTSKSQLHKARLKLRGLLAKQKS